MAGLDGSRQFLQLGADFAEGWADDGSHIQRRLQLDGVRLTAVIIVGLVQQPRLHLHVHQRLRRQRHERQRSQLLQLVQRMVEARCVHHAHWRRQLERRRPTDRTFPS